MTNRPFYAFAIAAAAAVGGISAASALPAARPAAQERIVSDIATFPCVRDERGWHHMRGDRRVSCRPARPHGREWNWHNDGGRYGWWHRRDRRWHDAG